MVKGHRSPFRRGDIVLVAFPLITDFSQSKVRPAVVVQTDVGNRFSPNLIVAAISSRIPRRAYPTNFIVRLDTPRGPGHGTGSGFGGSCRPHPHRPQEPGD
ncbi:MAG: type II toxin-antitoxin system PemK/MazF family toxin [Anaerolineae bacterium]